jgi:hypothetical protein
MLRSVCVVSALLFASSAIADPATCRNAVDEYQSAASDVATYLQAYASCVSSSAGKDDCSSEFSSVQSAQSDFESAVSEYETECD